MDDSGGLPDQGLVEHDNSGEFDWHHDNDNDDDNNNDNDNDIGWNMTKHQGVPTLRNQNRKASDAPATNSSQITSARRAIPVPKPSQQQQQATAVPSHHYAQHSLSLPSSQGSSGSAFLSSVLNFPSTLLLSHTPPTTLGTSYETTHFGKRPRAGSVSGRLRSASEYLEDKGLLDRATKGILKDLIIIGDEELQTALDWYEAGDPAPLERMISSGALQNRLPADLDILGDFTLDFLKVHDDDDHDHHHDDIIEATYTQLEEDQHDIQNGATKSRLENELYFHAQSTHQQQQQLGEPYSSTPHHLQHYRSGQSSPNTVTPAYDDGIGELEFAGEFVSDQEVHDFLQHQMPPHLTSLSSPNYGGPAHDGDDPSADVVYSNAMAYCRGSKSASPVASPTETATTMSSDYERRLRSNSLFSALLTEEPVLHQHHHYHHQLSNNNNNNHNNNHNLAFPQVTESASPATDDNNDDAKYERWMERVAGVVVPTTTTSQSLPDDNDDNDNDEDDDNDDEIDVTSDLGRRKSGRGRGIRITPTRTPTQSSPQRGTSGGIGASLAANESASPPDTTTPRTTRKYEKRKDKDGFSPRGRRKKEDAKEESMEVVEHVPGSGVPRALSDPSFRRTHDEFGLAQVERPDGWVGAYSPESRRVRIDRFLVKRNRRVWSKTIKYDVRKNFADSRLRVKGRFVRKEDEVLMRELMSLT